MSYSKKQYDLTAARDEKNRQAVNVAFICKVLTFDPATMTVDVQPLNKALIDGEYYSASPIVGIRASCLCSGDFVIRPWYKRGDIGFVIVCDSDNDNVLLSGVEAVPNTARNHSIEDCIFIGGICVNGAAPTGLPENALVLAAGDKYIALKQSGISINGNVQITGNLSISNNLTSAGIDITNHTHRGDSGGITSAPM